MTRQALVVMRRSLPEQSAAYSATAVRTTGRDSMATHQSKWPSEPEALKQLAVARAYAARWTHSRRSA